MYDYINTVWFYSLERQFNADYSVDSLLHLKPLVMTEINCGGALT